MGQAHIWRLSGQGKGHRSTKGRKSVFPQCKTSVGNNSGSIDETAVKFACSMGSSAMVAQTMLPPSLSRDRKYTHLWVSARAQGLLVNVLWQTCKRFKIGLLVYVWTINRTHEVRRNAAGNITSGISLTGGFFFDKRLTNINWYVYQFVHVWMNKWMKMQWFKVHSKTDKEPA